MKEKGLQTGKSIAMIERAYMRFIPAATAGEGCEGQGTVTAPHLDRLEDVILRRERSSFLQAGRALASLELVADVRVPGARRVQIDRGCRQE